MTPSGKSAEAQRGGRAITGARVHRQAASPAGGDWAPAAASELRAYSQAWATVWAQAWATVSA